MLEKLYKLLGEENVLQNEPMSMHTTFKVGGPAEYFAYVSSEESLIKTIELLENEKYPYFVLGNGSNLLVSDDGYKGVILKLIGEFEIIHETSNGLAAGSGNYLSSVAYKAYEDSFTGMEFASGIPGCVGGAILMNAGAYDGEMKDIVESVRVLWIEDCKCRVETVSVTDMNFSYRNSILKSKKGIVLAVRFILQKGSQNSIKEKMEDLNRKRREKQPLEYASAGSTFKRPEGYFAGKLISDAGLKGEHIGQAYVSEKHAGFIVNKGGARAHEIKELMDKVTDIILKKDGIKLEPEVIFLGDFS